MTKYDQKCSSCDKMGKKFVKCYFDHCNIKILLSCFLSKNSRKERFLPVCYKHLVRYTIHEEEYIEGFNCKICGEYHKTKG